MNTLLRSNNSVVQSRDNLAALQWFALKVRTRSEATAATGLSNRGYELFSPTYQERRKYSDRIKAVELPIFPGYVFCRFRPAEEGARNLDSRG